MRAETSFARKGGRFELETEKPGNLFTYDEPVRIIARLKNVAAAGKKKLLKYKVYDYHQGSGRRGIEAVHGLGRGTSRAGESEHRSARHLSVSSRGRGWESRETTFCRIPDLAAITRATDAAGFHGARRAAHGRVARKRFCKSPAGWG